MAVSPVRWPSRTMKPNTDMPMRLPTRITANVSHRPSPICTPSAPRSQLIGATFAPNHVQNWPHRLFVLADCGTAWRKSSQFAPSSAAGVGRRVASAEVAPIFPIATALLMVVTFPIKSLMTPTILSGIFAVMKRLLTEKTRSFDVSSSMPHARSRLAAMRRATVSREFQALWSFCSMPVSSVTLPSRL